MRPRLLFAAVIGLALVGAVAELACIASERTPSAPAASPYTDVTPSELPGAPEVPDAASEIPVFTP
ncbi:MAG: hypothetical protein HYU51_02160 [Candidatus Rokubacteria bacterium]|nr:hypothetical protein [Candidatus Rokubacteria bacterium]